jgi:hypothetical protein
MSNHTCQRCFGEIHPIRLEYGYHTCVKCATKGVGQSKYRGAMVYLHKTAGELVVMSEETFSDFKAKTRRVGQSSVLRHAAPAGGRLI